MREWDLPSLTAEKIRVGKAVFRHAFSNSATTIARLHYRFARRTVVCDIALTSVTYVEPVPNASEHTDYRLLFEELETAV